MNAPKKLGAIVAENQSLNQLYAQAQMRAATMAAIKRQLPDQLTGHLVVAGVTNRCLTLLASNAAWATEARCKTPEIIDSLREIPEFSDLHSLRIKIASAQPAASQESKRGRTISALGAARLDSAAASVEDPDIAAALKKLARRGDGNKAE